MDLDICHLLALPAGSAPPGALEPAPAPRDAPDFFAVEIEFRSAGGRAIEIDGVRVDVTCQVLDDLVWLADCRYQLRDAFADDAAARKRAIEDALHDQLLLQAGAETGIEVRYSVVMVSGCAEPEAFVAKNASALARLVRTLPKPPGSLQVEEILRARASYSHSDLTIVDWVGGVIITDHGGHQYDIELLKIGNYQLLRYRMLDRAIDRNLEQLRTQLADPRPRWRPGRQRTIATVVEQRLELLLAFEKTAQSLLFIGEWYSARVYWLIVQELCLNDWRDAVSAKLESLAAIDQTVRESLVFSWRRVLDLVQLAGWAFLLVGYFVLFILNNS
ncbi:MAG: hypothetical protein QOG33_2216 [Gaiellales bacterium]|nr:hypothetical protein [Gaiellales bacterium]